MTPQVLLFVESNTTGSGMVALTVARALGKRPVLLTSRPGRYRELADTGAEVVVCDTNSATALRAAVAAFPPGELAGITTTSEFYVTPVADLAARHGLPGNPPDAVRVSRDKAAVRRALATADSPRFAEVDAPDEIAGALAYVGLPCVVKPVDDSGSNLVQVCATEAEARAQVSRVLARQVNVRDQPVAGRALVEQYLTGPEVSVEMFGWAGSTTCVGITAKQLTGFPHCVEHRHLYPADLGEAEATRVAGLARDVLAATGLGYGPSHIEARLTPAGPALVELNPRLAGGMIPELVRLVDGIDLLEQQLRTCLGEEPRLRASRAGCAGIQFLTAPRTGRLTEVAGTGAAARVPGVVEVRITARPGDPVAPPDNAYSRLGFVIARGDDHAQVARALDAASGRITVRMEAGHDRAS
jgi:S-sulfo-L-cysteine synthase (3-phospho-L-serine-dependent)